MQKLSDRIRSLEISPFYSGRRPYGMGDAEFAQFISDMGDRERSTFIGSMSDAELQVTIAFLKNLFPTMSAKEASHAA